MPRRYGSAQVLVCAVAACLFVVSCSSGSGRSSRTSPSAATTSTHGATSTTTAVGSGAQWTTYFGDAARTGVASDGPSSVSGLQKSWTSPVLDGDVYAQPLIVGERVIVATENDTVYALDASNAKILWKAHLGDPVPGSSLPCGNVDPVGITSTPVVDTATNRVDVVGMVQPGQHTLFEVDLASGRVVDSKRVDAEGSDPRVQNQRAALTLSNGKVFIPYGGRFGDCGDYHGRVVAVVVAGSGIGTPSAYLLPTQNKGGLWAPAGAAVARDASLYLASGNSSSRGPYDYGNSVIRLSHDLQLVDSFAPRNWGQLNSGDTDLGSTGPLLLPGNRVFQIGKAGTGYLLDAQHLGGVGGELYSASVCRGSSFGAIAHDGNTLFVPCGDSVTQVTVSGDRFTVGWTTSVSAPGPTIIAGGAVWVVATRSGDLLALDRSSGTTISTQHLGRVPSQFTSAAAGGGRVVAAADRTVQAFGN